MSAVQKDAERLEFKRAFSNDQRAARTAKSWSAWPACLDGGGDDRMRRELLNQAAGEQGVCTCHAFNYTTRKEDKKKRDGLVLGENKAV